MRNKIITCVLLFQHTYFVSPPEMGWPNHIRLWSPTWYFPDVYHQQTTSVNRLSYISIVTIFVQAHVLVVMQNFTSVLPAKLCYICINKGSVVLLFLMYLYHCCPSFGPQRHYVFVLSVRLCVPMCVRTEAFCDGSIANYYVPEASCCFLWFVIVFIMLAVARAERACVNVMATRHANLYDIR